MKWEKQGHIFSTSSKFFWNKTHAQVPIVDIENEGFWRIYYATRSIEGKSSISYFDVEPGLPEKILYMHDSPILNIGEPGTFDDSGLMPTSILSIKKEKLLYYIGWTTHNIVPFSNAIGVALFQNNSFKKVFKGPIIGRSSREPFFCGTCCVININQAYYAYYLSCLGWKEYENRMEPIYNIKIARSHDAITWECNGDVAIELLEKEGGIASASVIEINNEYHMWFSVRGEQNYRKNKDYAYRLGYAKSFDGINWIRNDNNALIKISGEGWDSEMIAYPNVIKYKDELYMFYNGNGFGRTGIGYAKAKI